MKRIYGIVGWPVWHSRSPAMHAAAFAAVGLDAVYVPFGVAPSRLAEAVRGLSALGIRGANVTLPHKSAIAAMLDEVEAEAVTIGAVNTIVREGKRLVGANTDAAGLVRALEEAGVEPRGMHAIVIGSGGAARAAIVGLASAGARRITIGARHADKAAALARELSPKLGSKLTSSALGATARAAFEGADLLVQATSATLDDGPEAARFASKLALDTLGAGAVVTDLVYTPRQTAVLRAAARRGLRTVDGMGMLLHQGALAFERWTGRPAPLQAMRETLR